MGIDLGTFKGWNKGKKLVATADEVIGWDHERDGKAVFVASGDCPEVALVFGRAHVTADGLLAFRRLVETLPCGFLEASLAVYFGFQPGNGLLMSLTLAMLEEVQVFTAGSRESVRRNAANALFARHYPQEYCVWKTRVCEGLEFNADKFLASPDWLVAEVEIRGIFAILVADRRPVDECESFDLSCDVPFEAEEDSSLSREPSWPDTPEK